MKISLNWLKEFVSFSLSAEEIADILSNIGLPVAEIEHLGQGIENVVVGEVIEVGPHPQANKLRLCVVTDGKSRFPVVCGAPNVEVNQKFPFALPGAKLPNGLKIETRPIRGIESQGMLCSTTELALEEGKAEGILLLPDNAVLGDDIHKILGLDDIIIEAEITPNRGDCLSHLGIAREISAVLGLSLTLPKISFKETKTNMSVTVEIRDTFCTRYLGRTINGVSVGPSPLWLRNRLRNCGLRPINNLVDITNYVLLETGHPLHMFDKHLITGRKIVVRWAKKGEKLLCLNGKERVLDTDIPVIADKNKPVALAGIVGGEESAVKENTVDVFLESAYFIPGAIRYARKKMELNTESSYRFERAADWENVVFSSRRAIHLVQELCHPQIIEPQVDVITRKYQHHKIDLRFSRTNKIIGTNIAHKKVVDILKKLYFSVTPSKTKDNVRVVVPSWRNDVTQEIDLIEEVARVYGYTKIPDQVAPYRSIMDESDNNNRVKEKRLRDLFVGWGFFEVVNYSFIGNKDFERLRLLAGTTKDSSILELDNPLSEEIAVLRTSLIPRILKNVEYNLSRQMEDIKFFEIGKIFLNILGKVEEKLVLAGAMTGKENQKHWTSVEKTIDFYAVSGIIRTILEFVQIEKFEFVPANINYLASGITFDIIVDNKRVGNFGELHPEIAGNYKFVQKVYLFEIMLEELLPLIKMAKKYRPIPIHPYIRRDISFTIPEKVSYGQIQKLILQTAGKRLKECNLIDVYQGENIGSMLSSITCSLVYQDLERTLTNEEIDQYQNKVISVLEEKLGAKLRG